MAAISTIDPRREAQESSQRLVHPPRHLRTHPTTVVSIPFDVRFFTGARLSHITSTTNTMGNPTLRIPLGILAKLITTRNDAGSDVMESTLVNGLLIEQICAGVVAGVVGRGG